MTGYFVQTCPGVAGCVFAWGSGVNGKFGDGTSGYRAEPKPIPGFGDVAAIAGGASENPALRADGTVWAWGSSEAVPGLSAYRPVQVPGLSGITAIAAGPDNGLALGSDGTVWSWGETRAGQLGDGVDHEADYLTTPVRVAGLTEVVAIASGYDNGYAVKSDGTVWSWGENHYGSLGNGVACDSAVPGTCQSNVPVQVVDMTDAVAVSEDGFARKADGTVVAWGSNLNGQIGHGSPSTEHVPTPTPVSGLTGAVAIASGDAHNGYALTSDGTLWGWGNNLSSQLGADSPRRSTVPLRVADVSGIGVSRISGFDAGLLALVPAG